MRSVHFKPFEKSITHDQRRLSLVIDVHAIYLALFYDMYGNLIPV